MITPTRIQEKGQVTIPSEVRRKLNWKGGDMVTFVMTDNGVEIKSLDAMADDMLSGLREPLKKRGISLDSLMKRSLQIGGNAAALEFKLTKAENETFIKALFLRAQAAVSAFQSEAKRSGADKLTEKEIEAEIQAVRRGNRNANRS
jgi:AbrB family looped-hinge helix DNA binding protein